jgi:SAM-dependent MidA family methyltransferase
MGKPDDVRLVELGPGRGTLMADMLRATAVVAGFRDGLSAHLVEVSPVLRRQQQERLAGLGVPMDWHADAAEVPDGPLIVIANEFFDALPVHQAVKAADGWHERMVGLDGNRLRFGLNPDPVRGLDATLPPRIRAAPNGAMCEWRADQPLAGIARRLVECGGAMLVIDYGHAESGVGETLQAMSRHGYADPLAAPGEADLTAHVDFRALGRTAATAGARVHGPIRQGEFLRRLGIAERAAQLKTKATARQAADIDAALARLTASGQTGMGELFKAIAFSDPNLASLPGFEP